MNDTTAKVMKVLVYNIGVEPILKEKFEFPITERILAKQTVLAVMNRMGKNSEAVVRTGAALHLFSHTAQRGPSSELYHAKINYHPLSKEIE